MEDIRWVRPTKQERSQKTLDRFLDAVEALFEEGGIESVSVADIAKRAGLSVGAFYARFPNKEAALQAVHERFCVEGRITADEALGAERWLCVHAADIVPRMVAFLVEDYRRRRGLRRVILILNGTDEGVRERSKELSGHVTERLYELFKDHEDELGHPDLRVAAEVLHRLIFSMLDNAVLFLDGSSTGTPLPTDVFVRELTALVCGYLRVLPKPDAA